MERRYRYLIAVLLLLPSIGLSQFMVDTSVLEPSPVLMLETGGPIISANPYLYLSTSNPYGPWGSEQSYYSFTNDYGPIGSPESYYGVSNPNGAGLRIRFVEPVFESVEVPFEIFE